MRFLSGMMPFGTFTKGTQKMENGCNHLHYLVVHTIYEVTS